MEIIKQSWRIPIDKLMYWRADSWMKYDIKLNNLCLRIHGDQLVMLNNYKVLESLNMNGKIKGIFKDDVLILIVCSGAQDIRKFKFQIKQDAAQHLHKLGEHFPVVDHHNKSNSLDLRYRKIEEVFKCVTENYDKGVAANLPPNFKDFIKLCLLDPAFPSVVHDTQKIIQSEILKEK